MRDVELQSDELIRHFLGYGSGEQRTLEQRSPECGVWGRLLTEPAPRKSSGPKKPPPTASDITAMATILRDFRGQNAVLMTALVSAMDSARQVFASLQKIDPRLERLHRPATGIRSSPREDARQDELETEITKRFRRFDAVRAVYVQRSMTDLLVVIVLSVPTWDDALMDNLLDEEYEIRQRWSDRALRFFYPPCGQSEEGGLAIHPSARRLFER
jgi:hypothetical protein